MSKLSPGLSSFLTSLMSVFMLTSCSVYGLSILKTVGCTFNKNSVIQRRRWQPHCSGLWTGSHVKSKYRRILQKPGCKWEKDSKIHIRSPGVLPALQTLMCSCPWASSLGWAVVSQMYSAQHWVLFVLTSGPPLLLPVPFHCISPSPRGYPWHLHPCLQPTESRVSTYEASINSVFSCLNILPLLMSGTLQFLAEFTVIGCQFIFHTAARVIFLKCNPIMSVFFKKTLLIPSE